MAAFSYPPTWDVRYSGGFFTLGSGLTVTSSGQLAVASPAGGTVTAITTGTGLIGGTINTSGTISLRPPLGGVIGGVKAGSNIHIATDGTISAVLPSGIGTVTGVFSGTGLSGGGVTGGVTLTLKQATLSALGGVIVGSTLTIGSGGTLNVPFGTTSGYGIVRLATNAETITGALSTVAVTPQSLASKVATTGTYGITILSDSTTSPATTQAATSAAVRTVNNLVTVAQTTASDALPKSGGTMTGSIVFASGQTFSGVGLPIATATSPGVVIPSTGLAVNSSGFLTTTNNGTVTSVTSGVGLGAPATGNVITTSGTLRLLAATSSVIGGVKPGLNLAVALDGTLNVGDVLLTNRPYAYNSYVWPLEVTPGQAPGVAGSYLQLVDNITGEVAWSTIGVLNGVTAGTGLTATTTSGIATVSLTTIGSITAGSYGATSLIPTFSVNAQGQLVSVGSTNCYPPFQIATISAPPNLVLDFDTNNTNWDYTLTANLVISNPLNAQTGMTGAMRLQQDPLSPYAISWGTSWKFEGASPPVISPVAGAVDFFTFTVIASNYVVVTSYLSGIG